MTDHQMLMETDEETGEQFPVCPDCSEDWPCLYARLMAAEKEIADWQLRWAHQSEDLLRASAALESKAAFWKAASAALRIGCLMRIESMHTVWLALLDVWDTATASLPPDAREWERQARGLHQQRAEDRLLAALRGDLPR